MSLQRFDPPPLVISGELGAEQRNSQRACVAIPKDCCQQFVIACLYYPLLRLRERCNQFLDCLMLFVCHGRASFVYRYLFPNPPSSLAVFTEWQLVHRL